MNNAAKTGRRETPQKKSFAAIISNKTEYLTPRKINGANMKFFADKINNFNNLTPRKIVS